MSVVAAASTIKHASRRAATLTSNPTMSSPASLIVNNQLGSKAYRLDHSLQTHFSRAARAATLGEWRQNSAVATASVAFGAVQATRGAQACAAAPAAVWKVEGFRK